jgi:nitrogen fixation/metabolism regulation signal transduction histidine kinase
MAGRPKPPKLTHERRALLTALAAGLPGVLLSMGLLIAGGYSSKVQWTFGLFVIGLWLGFAFGLRGTVVRPLQTLSNLLAAMREGDFSFRARGSRGDDALGEVMVEVNALATTLREQRLGALEATALLQKVMEEIDVAVFTFDGDRRLKLVNRAGERLLAQRSERLLGRSAGELGLEDAIRADAAPVLELALPGGAGRFEAHRGTFRQGGLPHQLLVLTNLSRALREEERQAWQRLIRVLGHELNNSLAPIRSIAGSLESLLGRDDLPADWQSDARRGLGVIRARSESLSRFMEAYARLARLPAPQLQAIEIGGIVRRVAGLETRLPIEVKQGREAVLRADPDQLEQLLINLVKNASEAALETGGGVRVGWHPVPKSRWLEVFVEDDGPGLTSTANLFVPFFTTKPEGSGIGLVLCRQIAEAHGGSLSLANRKSARGCRAALRLPL